jgi:cbb3-type cytochrome oxidase subunit 3
LSNLEEKLQMFSSGQLLFAVFFIISFTAIVILMYRKDAKGHKIHYAGSYKILIGFILAIFALFLIKVFVH